MNELTTSLNRKDFAALSAEAARRGVTPDELATELAGSAMKMRFRKQAPGSKTGVIVPMEINRASSDPAGGRPYESEESETAAQTSAANSHEPS